MRGSSLDIEAASLWENVCPSGTATVLGQDHKLEAKNQDPEELPFNAHKIQTVDSPKQIIWRGLVEMQQDRFEDDGKDKWSSIKMKL